MAIPEKREDLISAGYEFTGESRCKGCGEYIEWYVTPHGKRMPMTVQDVKDESKIFPQPILRTIRVPHWQVCPNAEDFRKPKEKK